MTYINANDFLSNDKEKVLKRLCLLFKTLSLWQTQRIMKMLNMKSTLLNCYCDDKNQIYIITAHFISHIFRQSCSGLAMMIFTCRGSMCFYAYANTKILGTQSTQTVTFTDREPKDFAITKMRIYFGTHYFSSLENHTLFTGSGIQCIRRINVFFFYFD